MVKIFYAIFKTIRPRQWLKNIALFTTVVFTGNLFNPELLLKSLLGFLVFCFLASSNYIFNDILDIESDKKHPFKKFRPITNQDISVGLAGFISMLFSVIGLFISFYIGNSFFVMAIIFISLQYVYSLYLKKIAIIDILTITAGYILRVYAGEAATGYHISVWLALTALSISLFLAIGKRRAEITLLNNYSGIIPKDTRIALSQYSEKLLDTYTAMFANATFITYSFYTFLERPITKGVLFQDLDYYNFDLTNRKWMMISIPFVLFGIMRYMQLIYEGQGESPEKILTSDIPLLSTVILWGLIILFVIYGIGG